MDTKTQFSDQILQTLISDAPITGAEIARRIGVSKQVVHKYKNGETRPNLDTLARLADTLGVTVQVFFVNCRK